MPPASGIKLHDNVKHCYNRVFQSKKDDQKLPYAVYKFSDDLSQVVVDDDDKFYKKTLCYTDLLKALPENSPRFIAVDFAHLNKDKNKVTTPIIISWVPKDTPIKLKFAVGTTFLGLISALGSPKYVEGEEFGDVNEFEVCDKNGWAVVPDDMRDPVPEGCINLNL